MTTQRTIPANPQPGERYAERTTNNPDVWDITEGDGTYVCTLSEPDARLLVFGAKAAEALKFVVAHECRDTPCIECYNKCRNTLAALEGKS